MYHSPWINQCLSQVLLKADSSIIRVSGREFEGLWNQVKKLRKANLLENSLKHSALFKKRPLEFRVLGLLV